MKAIFYGIIVVLSIGLAVLWYFNSHTKTPVEINSFAECESAGYPVMESYPRQCRAGDRTFTEDIGEDKGIHIAEPLAGQVIDVVGPLVVRGEARGRWYFEAVFGVRGEDGQGHVIGQSFVTARTDWMTENFVPFRGELSFTQVPSTTDGFIVFTQDDPSGMGTPDQYRLPVKFNQTEVTTVKVFFNTKKDDPNLIYCERTYPVTRLIPKTAAIARAAVEELLKGPTEAEAAAGYFSNIPVKSELKSVVIENAVATADFNDELEKGGGSCRAAAISSSITNTLKQFSTVKSVVISINGRTEDILQP